MISQRFMNGQGDCVRDIHLLVSGLYIFLFLLLLFVFSSICYNLIEIYRLYRLYKV